MIMHCVHFLLLSTACTPFTQLAEVFDSVIHDAMKSLGYCCGGRVCADICLCVLGWVTWYVAKEVVVGGSRC